MRRSGNRWLDRESNFAFAIFCWPFQDTGDRHGLRVGAWFVGTILPSTTSLEQEMAFCRSQNFGKEEYDGSLNDSTP